MQLHNTDDAECPSQVTPSRLSLRISSHFPRQQQAPRLQNHRGKHFPPAPQSADFRLDATQHTVHSDISRDHLDQAVGIFSNTSFHASVIYLTQLRNQFYPFIRSLEYFSDIKQIFHIFFPQWLEIISC